jgi:preprotein translocase subunit Sec61beta
MKKTENAAHPNIVVYALMMVTLLLLACMLFLRG